MHLSIPAGLTRSVAHQTLMLKKNSPHIFFGAGIVGAVGATVLACRATLKLEETLDEIKVDVEKVKVAYEAQTITTQEKNRLMVLKAGRGMVKIGRLYGPSILLGAASVAALSNSHATLARRNSALTGGLAMASQAFEEYRERVRTEIGDEKERDVYYGITHEEQTIDGKKRIVPVRGPEGLTRFAVVIDANSGVWERYPDLTLQRIKAAEAYIQQRVDNFGFAFLNDAYQALGIEDTSDGAIFGWVKNKPNEPTTYVDFGLDSYPTNSDFLMGNDTTCVLDFNVSGVMYHLVDGKKLDRGARRHR